VTTFLIVRHGETDWNVAGRLQGWRDSPLTANGRAQAAAVAARLAGEPIDALVASDLGRTRETAARSPPGSDCRSRPIRGSASAATAFSKA
jgi:broad specificity phosphatase PhoE